MYYFTKSHIFLYLMLLLALSVLYKTISLPCEGVIDVNISKQHGEIATLDTVRHIDYTLKISTNTLFFQRSRMLSHKCVGKLGFTENFFLDADVDMQVLQPGKYQFTVLSDDGFRMLIDNKTICEHTATRSYEAVNCSVVLTKGLHHFKLHYFQATDSLGLRVGYRLNDSLFHDIGKDSDEIQFKERK